jgi:hypothetical protein
MGEVKLAILVGMRPSWVKKVVGRSCGDASQAEFISSLALPGRVRSKADSLAATASETVSH